MVEGIPVKFEDCPQHKRYTFRSRPRSCKCGICRICGHSKHTAVHGGIMGHEGENVVWGHQFKPASWTRTIPAGKPE